MKLATLLSSIVMLLSLLLAPELLRAQKNILYVGDSHSAMKFGQVLRKNLIGLEMGDIKFIGKGGATPMNFVTGAPTPYQQILCYNDSCETINDENTIPVEQLLKNYKAQILIVALGSNIVGRSKIQISNEMTQLIVKIRSINPIEKCIWVGHPDMSRFTKEQLASDRDTEKQTAENLGCYFIDSLKYTYYPKNLGDGIHYDTIRLAPNKNFGKLLATQWANFIFMDIKKYLQK